MIKVILGEEWDGHRGGTTVDVDRSRGSWLLSRGGRPANAESARELGVVWVEPKPERKKAVKKDAAPRKSRRGTSAATKSASSADTKPSDDEKE